MRVLLTLLKQGEVGQRRLPDLLAKTAGISPRKAAELVVRAKHKDYIELTSEMPITWRITTEGRGKCTPT